MNLTNNCFLYLKKCKQHNLLKSCLNNTYLKQAFKSFSATLTQIKRNLKYFITKIITRLTTTIK